MLKALAAEIDNASALCDNYGCLIITDIDPETDADHHAMNMLGLAVEHMVELWASSIEELAVKAGAFYRHMARSVLLMALNVTPIMAEFNALIAQDAGRLFGRPAAAWSTRWHVISPVALTGGGLLFVRSRRATQAVTGGEVTVRGSRPDWAWTEMLTTAYWEPGFICLAALACDTPSKEGDCDMPSLRVATVT